MKSRCYESLDYLDALREYRACIGNVSRTAIFNKPCQSRLWAKRSAVKFYRVETKLDECFWRTLKYSGAAA
jgi:hypothetical protein